MASLSKCCQCEEVTEQLLGICIECVESIMKSLNDLPEPQNTSQVSGTTEKRCRCMYSTEDATAKVDLLIKDCDIATTAMNQRNIDETERRKATKP